jgi:Putative adhesin
MRAFISSLVVLFLLCGIAAADNWNKTYQLTGIPDLTINTSDGNIHIDTWDQNRIEARVTTTHYTIDSNGVRITESQTGDRVSIDVHIPQVHFGWEPARRVDIDIHMPRQGRLDLHTNDGSIRLADFKGDMRIRSGDGGQDLQNLEGSLQAQAGDGHISVAGRFDNLDLHTGDGRIEARIRAGSRVSTSWGFHTGDGSIRLELPPDFGADVDAHSGDGHISFDMPITVSGSLSRNNVRGKLNGGGGILRLRSGDGSIYVRKG